MTGHDYRQSWWEVLLGRRPHFSLPTSMYAPLAAVAGALVLIGCLSLVQWQRATAVGLTLHDMQDRLAIAHRADLRGASLTRSVTRLRDLQATLLANQRKTVMMGNSVARIGNALPPQTWLTHIRADRNGTWLISGRSTRVDRIAGTLDLLTRIDRRGQARLVSITAAGTAGHLLDFSIAWDLQL